MKVWIDADAAPREVKDVVFRATRRLEIETVLVASQGLFIPVCYPRVRSVAVPGGPDAADHYIVANAQPEDLAISADIELAQRLVLVRVTVIDPRGHEYTADNVGERRSVRDFMEGLRGAGMRTSGPRPYSEKDKRSFAATLDRVLTRLLRRP